MNLRFKRLIIPIVSLLLWSIITLVRLFHHAPWYDEAHAWIIARDLNLLEMIKFMHIEGHTFLWYLIIMPFAKLNFHYPYPMQILNWIFCFIAIVILWWKAPFNNAIKFLISFSFPFLGLYPILARCYAIGIMFLFIIAAMEKKKLEHPIWYSTLLILCANTSVMAMIGAGAFGLIFIYDLIKEKNKDHIIKSFSIMLLGLLLVALQFWGITESSSVVSVPFSRLGLSFFKGVFVYNAIIFNLVVIGIFVGLMLFFFIKNKIFPAFLVFTYMMLAIFFYFYTGEMWHHYFFYIYFIISLWLLFVKYDYLKFRWICLTILIVLSIIYVFSIPYNYNIKNIYSDPSKDIAEVFLKDENIKESRIIIFRLHEIAIEPYLRKDIELYNYCTSKKVDKHFLSFYSSKYCRLNANNNEEVKMDFDYLKNMYAENTYFLAYSDLGKTFYLDNGNEYFVIDLYKKFKNLFLYRVKLKS